LGAWSRGMIFASHVKGQGFNSPRVHLFAFLYATCFFFLLLFSSFSYPGFTDLRK
jgi:hypothetical protein